MQRLLPFLSMAFAILIASISSADPILMLSTDEVMIRPAPCSEPTAINIVVDTNDTSLANLTLTFTTLASGFEVVGVTAGAGIARSGPFFDGVDWAASFGAGFGTDRTDQIVIGTLFLAAMRPGHRWCGRGWNT